MGLTLSENLGSVLKSHDVPCASNGITTSAGSFIACAGACRWTQGSVCLRGPQGLKGPSKHMVAVGRGQIASMQSDVRGGQLSQNTRGSKASLSLRTGPTANSLLCKQLWHACCRWFNSELFEAEAHTGTCGCLASSSMSQHVVLDVYAVGRAYLPERLGLHTQCAGCRRVRDLAQDVCLGL